MMGTNKGKNGNADGRPAGGMADRRGVRDMTGYGG